MDNLIKVSRNGLLSFAAFLFLFASLPAHAVQWQKLSPADLLQGGPASNASLRMSTGAVNASRFELRRRLVSARGTEHWRYQQQWLDLPIWGEFIDLHRRGSKGTFVRGRAAIDMPASRQASSLTETDVLNNLQKDVQTRYAKPAARWAFRDSHAERVWYIDKGKAVEAFAVYFRGEIQGEEPLRFNALIDASNGTVIRKWNGLTHADAIGPGGNEKTGQYHFGTDLPTLDVTQNGTDCQMRNINVNTVNLNNSESGTTHQFTCPENTYKETNGAYSPLNDAHFFGTSTYAMFQDWLGTPPLSFPLVLNVHYGQDYENAFWDGATMTFGDGGTTYYPLVDANVVAHEVAHGYTEQHSGLFYYDESGGINEAYSDMAGEALEYYVFGNVDWKVGATIYKDPEGALRYFEQPSRDGESIDSVDAYYPGMDVHNSSGIYNRAFYLVANSQGWNVRKAFEVFSFANHYYWQPASTFVSAACDSIVSANDLGYAWEAVNNAFAEVGIQCDDLPIDTDADGLPDNWELLYGLDPNNATDAGTDTDGDGLTSLDEFAYHTQPNDSDSDDDTLSDGAEINLYGTQPNNADTDSDRMPDGWEVQYAFNALDATDANEDRDGDSTINLHEFLLGTDPTDANSFPVAQNAYVESFENGSMASWVAVSGFAPWFVSDTFASDGSHSLRSADIEFGQTSKMEWMLYTSAGKLEFDAGIHNVTGYVTGSIYLDNVLIIAASGTAQQHFSIELATGLHTLRVEFYSDSLSQDSANAAWIDNLIFVGYTDNDNDGMYDGWETLNGLDPNNASDAVLDPDSDGLANLAEFTHNTNPQDADSDDDGALDGVEINAGSNPLDADTDDDTMLDGWELQYGLNVQQNDASGDADGDGVSNLDEFQFGSIPNDAASTPVQEMQYAESFESQSAGRWTTAPGVTPWTVTDQFASEGLYSLRSGVIGDNQTSAMQLSLYTVGGILEFDMGIDSEACCDFLQIYVDDVLVDSLSGDGQRHLSRELAEGRHTLKVNYVKDGSVAGGADAAWIDNVLFNGYIDTDADGLYDGWELAHGLDPNNANDAGQDNDDDGLSNLEEYQHGTDLADSDSDDDAASDSVEITAGSNPLDADTDDDAMPDGWELQYGLDANNNDAAVDTDGDGVSNLDEYAFGSIPNDAHSFPAVETSYFESFEGQTPGRWTGIVGITPWFVDNQFASDGSYSLRSGAIEHSQNAAMQLALNTTKGVLEFDVGVDSEACCDYLQIWVDGIWVQSLSGNTQQHVSQSLTRGFHTLKVIYSKDGSVVTGADAAWIDNVRFSSNDADEDGIDDEWEVAHGLDPANPADAALDGDQDGLSALDEFLLGTDLADSDSDDDGALDGAEIAVGSHPLDSDTDNDGLPDGWEIDYGLAVLLDDANEDTDGDGVSNRDEFSLGSAPNDAASVPALQVSYFDSFESNSIGRWSSLNGSTPWFTSNDFASDGNYSLRSGVIDNSDNSAMQLTLMVTGGTLTFDVGIDSEACCDYLEVRVDDVQLAYFAGSRQQQVVYQLESGFHTLQVYYSKDGSVAAGADAAWIDNIEFIGNVDTDGDGLSDGWEQAHGLDPANANDATLDRDGDSLSNLDEYLNGTDLDDSDSDDDAALDGTEISVGSDPLDADTDDDAMPDGWELRYQLNVFGDDTNDDLDGDGVSNLDEYLFGSLPDDAASRPLMQMNYFESFEKNSTGRWVAQAGVTPWFISEEFASGGHWSLRSGKIGDGETSSMLLNLYTGRGELEFDLGIDSESCCDFLQIWIDGNLVQQVAGKEQRHLTYVLASGTHTVLITYSKDVSVADGGDVAWIDNVRFKRSWH